MTITTTEPKTRTITLTRRTPIKIREDEWPIIARGDYEECDNKYKWQANRIWKISFRVRQHSDGRAVVYAVYDYDTDVKHEDNETYKVGRLLDAGGDLPAAIADTADDLIERISDEDMHRHVSHAADECIADLPAQEI